MMAQLTKSFSPVRVTTPVVARCGTKQNPCLGHMRRLSTVSGAATWGSVAVGLHRTLRRCTGRTREDLGHSRPTHSSHPHHSGGAFGRATSTRVHSKRPLYKVRAAVRFRHTRYCCVDENARQSKYLGSRLQRTCRSFAPRSSGQYFQCAFKYASTMRRSVSLSAAS